jgi:hypothetical protein
MNTRKWTVTIVILAALIVLGILGVLIYRSKQPRFTVYANVLSGKPGSEWSDGTISKTPKGDLLYLGKFDKKKVTLSLGGLPAHKLVQVAFDLLVLQSWDGSSATWGESRWSLDVVDGPNLIQTTFGNCGFFSDNNVQNFPDNRPFGAYPAWTGSSEHQTLGVIQSWGGPDRTFDCSSVYHFVLTFPHSGNEVKLCFQGYKKGKFWGLRNVQVRALPDFAAHRQPEFAGLWQELADNDPMVAFKAKWDLIAAGPAAVNLLADTLSASGTTTNSPAAAPDALRLQRTREILQVINTPDAADLLNQIPTH